MRRAFHIVLLLLTALLAVAFAMLNSAGTTVDLFVFEYTLPLSIVLIATLFIGVLIGMLVAAILSMRRHAEARALKRRLALAEEELQQLRKMPIKDGW